MSAGSTPRPRFQLRIGRLMILVAVAAVVLALPGRLVQFAAMIGAMPATIIGGATLLAPPDRRRSVAFWSAALYPLIMLGWLVLARSTWSRHPLSPTDHPLVLMWTLAIPYLDVFLAVLVILPALFFGTVVACVVRCGAGIERVFALPFLWAVTWIILACDPFDLRVWAWDW